MSSRRLRFAIVGAGRIAGDYIAALPSAEDLELVGVADTRLDLASTAGERAGVPAFASLESLLEAVEVDAVLVATPPNLHESLTVQSLEAGAHVLCEKPFALDTASARRMFDAARAHERYLTMSAKFRHVRDVVDAKARLTAGAIGTPLFVRQEFYGQVPMAGRWNSDPEVGGGGVWIDNGTHSVDLLRYLFGPVRGVASVAASNVQGLPVEDSFRAALEFDADCTAVVDVSWSIPATSSYYLECFGTQGSLHLGWRESVLRQGGSRERPVGRGYSKLDALGRQLAHFAEVAMGRGEPAMSEDDVLASVEVIEWGYRRRRESR